MCEWSRVLPTEIGFYVCIRKYVRKGKICLALPEIVQIVHNNKWEFTVISNIGVKENLQTMIALWLKLPELPESK